MKQPAKKVKGRTLKVGDCVINTKTKMKGWVRSDVDGDLLPAHDDFVQVYTRTKTGKNAGRRQYPTWMLSNLKLA